MFKGSRTIDHASDNYINKTIENKAKKNQTKQSKSEVPHGGLAKTVMSKRNEQTAEIAASHSIRVACYMTGPPVEAKSVYS
jgi:hypothetical protein